MSSLLHTIIGRLPSSKRSIADLRSQVSALQEQVTRLQDTLNWQYDTLRNSQEHMRSALSSEIRTNRTQSSMLQWALYRRDGEDHVSARQRFFSGLPQACGSLRLTQQGCAALLQEFTKIAERYDLPYWVDFGTLLGCVRHHGFIPWDDDVDLGMVRQDVQRLLELLQNEPTLRSRYRAVLVYDPYVCCRQLRLRYCDEYNPCFLDIFFYDYTPQYDYQQREQFVQLRKDLQNNLHSQSFYQQWLASGYVEAGGAYTQTIEEIFQRYQARAVSEGLITDRTDAKSLIYGIDNVDAENVYILPYNELFPLKKEAFEDFFVSIPNDAFTILERTYGDIYQLPDDIVSHFKHIDMKMLKNPAILESIEQSIQYNHRS